MEAELKCVNCSGTIPKKLPDVCVLEALAGVLVHVRERDPARVRAMLEHSNIDEIWSLLGPVVDYLEQQVAAFGDRPPYDAATQTGMYDHY